MLALRKMRSKDLAAEIGITEANLSLLKSGKVKGIRFATLEAICERADCKPGDILDYEPGIRPAERELTRPWPVSKWRRLPAEIIAPVPRWRNW